jgi:hypothetical protein
MSQARSDDVGRREFLFGTCAAVLGIGAFGAHRVAGDAATASEDDEPHTHNMLVVGEGAVFLSHLPMFDGAELSGGRPKVPLRSPHHYQVILEATFTRGGRNVQALYAKDRRANSGTKMYTLNPDEQFALRRLFAPEPRLAPLRSFTGTVFRGHFERGGEAIRGLEHVTVDVRRVVHARKFDPRATPPPRLEYLLFGRGAERFLAHLITAPPDFDQILSVTVGGRALTDDALGRGMHVGIPGRGRGPAQRVRERERVAGVLQAAGAAPASAGPVQLEAGVEFYFEEGELRTPATFARTSEERKAGF